MMKKILTGLLAVGLVASAGAAMAGQVPGDVNFGTSASPANHAFRYRLEVGPAKLLTAQTACVSPNTGFAQVLSYGAIGQTGVDVTIQAQDCAAVSSPWKTLNGFSYDKSNYYNIACDLNSGQCS